MKPTTYKAYAVSDLYNAGYACDGHPFIAECFYVLIEDAAGRRFRHFTNFNGTQQLVCEETGDVCFPDLREEALNKAERLAEMVNCAISVGQALNANCWHETDPAYGSDEYISQGTEAKRAFAERQGA
jgi:hypothetical protein